MDVLAADLQILTRIEDGRIVNKGLTDTSGHAKTKIGIDVDLADSAACSLTKLIFRNTNGILQISKRSCGFVPGLNLYAPWLVPIAIARESTPVSPTNSSTSSGLV